MLQVSTPPSVSVSTQSPPPCMTWQYNEYRIRIHFGGTKTLTQCLQNLAARQQER